MKFKNCLFFLFLLVSTLSFSAIVVLRDDPQIRIRSATYQNAPIVGWALNYQEVKIIDTYLTPQGEKWYLVKFFERGIEKVGWIRATYVDEYAGNTNRYYQY